MNYLADDLLDVLRVDDKSYDFFTEGGKITYKDQAVKINRLHCQILND